ncbi:MAG: amidohydrolase [Rhodospirillaceae bacterium]|jgi:amidohydrolase|nr:amidohydrolase [Rhodospirillaceae bacterium]MBT4689500.1 amidohydrolase [Rhodospirillaceae bacterium]MBT5079793.1 amidohydrolase [Rhodospirillaceae bacterium]MBT5523790.1 amidohydrolase [Rhodospirillaceae bacterium]MBT5881644.1 amidohydrolase [Rhodospirillaceae bacterium]
MPLIDDIIAMKDEIQDWRKDFHAHPELGFEENRTAEFVAAKLEEFGIQVHRGIGKTGVVGVLKVGNETTAVGLRADMDALPIVERNTFDHRSTNHGVMHACGHDGHSAMLLGAAKYLSQTQNFRGQVNFIFQPAEEGIGGARAMIEDGLFDQFPCDSLYAMHNAPGTPLGTFDATAGIRTAAGAFFDIEVSGKGAHGAFPHQGVDPVTIAGELIGALQTIVARNISPTETAVLSITQVHAGDAYNVIPATARLSGTIRTLSMDVMNKIRARLEQLASGIAASHGGSAEVDFRIIFHPVVNAEATAALAAEVCDELVGVDQVTRSLPPSTGSEDFSFMAEQVPSCYLHVGNGADSMPVHNQDYDFNDQALVYGASFFARIVERSLSPE